MHMICKSIILLGELLSTSFGQFSMEDSEFYLTYVILYETADSFE